MEVMSSRTFLLTLDFVHSRFPEQVFYDYIKSNVKEVVILNACEFGDVFNVRQSRTDLKRGKPKNTTEHIINGLKTRVSHECLKLRERKKKPDQESPSRKRHRETVIPRFGGYCDILFILVNYPLTLEHFSSLEQEGLHPRAFVTLVHEGPPQVPTTKTPKTNTRRLTRSRKSPVPEPPTVPPARWGLMKDKVNPSVIFTQIEVPETIEGTWATFEQEIVRLIQCSRDIGERFEEFVFVPIPLSSDIEPDPDITKIVLNAIQTPIPTKNETPTKKDAMNKLFEVQRRMLGRESPQKKVNKTQKPHSRPVTPFHLFWLSSLLKKWKLTDKVAFRAFLEMESFANSKKFHALAGERFDALFQLCNRKRNLGLPAAFFDWGQWTYSQEHENLQALDNDDISVIQWSFDETLGIAWVLVVPPIQKAIGNVMTSPSTWQTLNGGTEYYKEIFDKPQPVKGRQSQSLAAVLRSGGDVRPLVGDFWSRFREERVYHIPYRYCDVTVFDSPYFFDSGVKVKISRAIEGSSTSFSYSIHFPNQMALETSGDTINFNVNENIRFYFCFSMNSVTITSGDYSMMFRDGSLVLKRNGTQSMKVNEDGTLVYNNAENETTVVASSGAIGRSRNGRFHWTDVDKGAFIRKDPPVACPFKRQPLTDKVTGVTRITREDGVGYYTVNNELLRIEIDNMTLEKRPDGLTYTIHEFPILKVCNSKIHFELAGTSITCSRNEHRVECDKFVAKFENKRLNIEYLDTSAVLTPAFIDIHSGDAVLTADYKGKEVFGGIIDDDVKIGKNKECEQSLFGRILPRKAPDPILLCETFRPRFFAIRSDLTATEFLHNSQVKYPGFRKIVKQSDDLTFVSFHSDTESHMFEEYPSITRVDRKALAKIVVPPKKRMTAQEAMRSYPQFLKSFEALRHQMADILSKNQEEYLLEMNPPPAPPSPRLRQPVSEPRPRILLTQHEKVFKPNTNYWKSPESKFVIKTPVSVAEPKPFSPRTKLFDMPDPSAKKLKPEDLPQDVDLIFVSPPRSPASPLYHTEAKMRELGAHTVDLGRVDVGTTKRGHVTLRNTSTTPLQFYVTTFSGPELRLVNSTGKIAPGLSSQVKFELTPKTADPVDVPFNIRTPKGHYSITVTANADSIDAGL